MKNLIIGKSMTLKETQETGIIVGYYPEIRDEMNVIRNIPYVSWKSDIDGEVYATKLESVIVNE
jgi:hypothetical protein